MNTMTEPDAVVTQDLPDNTARTWGMLCHLSALLGLLGIPFGNVLGPLVVWLIKKNEIPYVDVQGKAALNFQISMTIYIVPAIVLCVFCVGIFLLIPLVLADIILTIVAAVKANDGKPYQYPLAIPFIK